MSLCPACHAPRAAEPTTYSLSTRPGTATSTASRYAPTVPSTAPWDAEPLGISSSCRPRHRGGQLLPMPLGDDFDVAVGHLDGSLVVDRVGGTRNLFHPLFRPRHGVAGHALLSQVWIDREVNDAQRAVVTCGRFPLDEVLPDPGGHHHAPRAQSHPDRLAQRRKQVRQPGLANPVTQVEGIAARYEQDVRLADPGDPALFVDAGQRCELEDSHRLPAQ